MVIQRQIISNGYRNNQYIYQKINYKQEIETKTRSHTQKEKLSNLQNSEHLITTVYAQDTPST